MFFAKPLKLLDCCGAPTWISVGTLLLLLYCLTPRGIQAGQGIPKGYVVCLAKHLSYYYIHRSRIQTSWCREGKSYEKYKVSISTTHHPDIWLLADSRSVDRKSKKEGPACLRFAAIKELQGNKLVRREKE